MDETKETKQDSSLNEDTSAGSKGTTSQVKTFTEEDVEKLVSNRLAAKGRDAKSLETREAAIKAQEEANKTAGFELERQRLETQRKELESVADDPDAKKALLRSYDLDKREREIEEKRQQDEAAVGRMFSDAEALAIEYNLKPSDLLVAPNPEAMKLLAKNLALERELDATKAKKETPKEEESGFTPDSGTSDAGADSDEAFQKRWNSGELPATKENIARAQKIINK